MVPFEELGTIKVVLQWRRWTATDRSSPLSECGSGFDSSLIRAHRSLSDERYADVAVLGGPRPTVNGSVQETHVHEPIFGAPSMMLKFHYAPQSEWIAMPLWDGINVCPGWLISSGKDNRHPMAMRRTTFASSSKHTLDHESPTSNIQVSRNTILAGLDS